MGMARRPQDYIHASSDPNPRRFDMEPDPYWVSDTDPALFINGFHDGNNELAFSTLFCLLLSIGTVHFTSVFKDNNILRSHKL
jgi:hypothetical protein